MKAKNQEDIISILRSEGAEISKEEAEEILNGRNSLKSKVSELSEDDLGKCAGGVNSFNYDDEDMGGTSKIALALGLGIGMGMAMYKDMKGEIKGEE